MRTRICCSAAGCLLSAITFGDVLARAAVDQAATQTLPFETVRGSLIAVRGTIGSIDGLRLLVDTGTSRTVVDRRISGKLGLLGTPDRINVFGQIAPAERVTLPRLDLGPMHAADLSVLAADLASVGQRLGTRLDAIVGLDVLRGHCFQIDYLSRRLVLDCRDGWRWYVGCDPRSPYLVASVIIDGREYRLFVDTGSDALAVFERAAPERSGGGEAIVPADSLLTSLFLRRFIADSITVGSRKLRREDVFVVPGGSADLGYDGVLGVRRLASRVQLDLTRMVVSWGNAVD